MMHSDKRRTAEPQPPHRRRRSTRQRDRQTGQLSARIPSSFIALVIAQLFSLTGESIAQFALSLHLLNLTESAALFGAAGAAVLIPYILCTPIGGALADRLPKQRLMAALDTALAATALCYLIGSGVFDAVVAIFAALMVFNAVQALYQPTIQASVSALVSTERVTQAVAVVSQVSTFTGIVGPVLGGVVFGFFGIFAALALVCALCTVSALLIAGFVRVPHARSVGEGEVHARNPLALFAHDIREAARFLKARPFMWQTIGVACLINMVLSAGITVGSPFIVTEYLGMGNQMVGVAQGALGVGGLAGGLLVAAKPGSFTLGRVPGYLLGAAAALAPLAVALAAGAAACVVFALLVLGLFAVMLLCTCVTVLFMGHIQMNAPEALVGKVMALMLAAVNCATPAGQVVYGMAFDAVVPVWIVGAMAAGVAVLAAVMRRVVRLEGARG